MSDHLDLSLPATAPVERYHDQPENLQPTALYTLIDISDPELQEAQRVCESECECEPEQEVRLAPQPRFLSGVLREIYDSHLELGAQGHYDPIYFIVITDRQWKGNGVLLVALDDDDLTCKTDSFMIKASDSGLSTVNLKIANTSWEEEKENYAITSSAGGTHPDDDDQDDQDGHSSESGPDFPDKAPVYPCYVPLYVVSPVDGEELIAKSLEPGASMKSKDPFKLHAVRLQASFEPPPHVAEHDHPDSKRKEIDKSVTDHLVRQASSTHPVRCRKNRWLHRSMFLVCDTTDPKENGLVLVKLAWDEVTTKRSKAELRKLGSQATCETQRIPATVQGTQEYFYGLVNNARIWRADHTLVMVFQFKEAGPPGSHFGKVLLDSKATKRKAGDEWVIYAPDLITEAGSMPTNVTWSFDEALRWFPWFCRRHRFAENLSRKYFICVDKKDLEKEGVLIAKVDWDQKLDRSREELLQLDLGTRVSTFRAPVGEALGMIEAENFHS